MPYQKKWRHSLNAQDPIPESAFGFEAAEDSPGFLLWQTTITWQRLIKKALDGYDISHMQFVIMASLLWFEEHQEFPTQATISRLSKIDEMTVSKSLRKLAMQGYVSRQESSKDTRAKCVSLTSIGRELTAKLIPIVEGIDRSFFNAVAKDDQRELIQILGKIIQENN